MGSLCPRHILAIAPLRGAAVGQGPPERFPMADILFLLIGIAFFALMAVYARWAAQA